MARMEAPGRLPPANHLLAALPPREYARLQPHFKLVSLSFGDVLYEPDRPIDQLYFPTGCVLSLISPADNGGDGVEIGLVGREGMAGLAVVLGADTAPFRCVVQVPGDCLRMRGEELRRRFGRDGTLHDLLLRYTNAFLAQVAQSAACNSLHSIERRLCRWLLAVHDRTEADRFRLTHEFLAAMLGVRRASVTEAARALRGKGLIRYGAGLLTVLDRPGLEAAACGCHRAIQREFDRFLADRALPESP
jgi:CRP-like cAMP-binding protein